MPKLTLRGAGLIAAGVGALIYAGALANGWAGDDGVVVANNPAVRSVGAALGSWFESYWPEPYRFAGLYRPVVILSYGIDWTISGGATWWIHLVNILLHALVCALVVRVAAAWLPPRGALVAGVIFAVHPIHVEAVANMVGRAELLAATGLLLAILAARRHREATDRDARRVWLWAVLGSVALALLSKEHGAVAIAILVVDDLCVRRPHRRPAPALYLSVLALTLGWLFVWRAIAASGMDAGAHPALLRLPWSERMTTMLPAYLEVVRLLSWPFRLTSDYSPLTIPVRTSWSVPALLGLTTALAVIALGFSSLRRVPAIAFGILLAVVSYVPTSNFFFVSGVFVAERALYLAVLAPAMAAGWLVVSVPATVRSLRWWAGVAAVLALVSTSVGRVPHWKSDLDLLVEELGAHPENYHMHGAMGDLLGFLGDSARGLAERLVGSELLPQEPIYALYNARYANDMGAHRVALREASRAYEILPEDGRVVESLIVAQLATGQLDSALRTAEESVHRLPNNSQVLGWYLRVLRDSGAPRWRILAGEATQLVLVGQLVRATARLDSLAAHLPLDLADPRGCRDAQRGIRTMLLLNPELAARITQAPPTDPPCQLDVGVETGGRRIQLQIFRP